MTKEEKSLLLIDLCSRLPYHCRVFYEYVDDLDNKTYGYSLTLNTWCIDEFNTDKAVVRPYLRPMSSMTEDEANEFETISESLFTNEAPEQIWGEVIDWLNAHHFDHRGLIERGLAIAVTEENNPYEKKE